jgi:hypothetical protein
MYDLKIRIPFTLVFILSAQYLFSQDSIEVKKYSIGDDTLIFIQLFIILILRQ